MIDRTQDRAGRNRPVAGDDQRQITERENQERRRPNPNSCFSIDHDDGHICAPTNRDDPG